MGEVPREGALVFRELGGLAHGTWEHQSSECGSSPKKVQGAVLRCVYMGGSYTAMIN